MATPRWAGVIATVAVVILVAATAGAGPAPGTVLNADTWQQADGLLPPEFLDRYKNGQWQHEVVEAPAGTHFGDEDFLAAGAKNAGQYALGPDGGVVESGSGKQPPYIYGPPFPVSTRTTRRPGPRSSGTSSTSRTCSATRTTRSTSTGSAPRACSAASVPTSSSTTSTASRRSTSPRPTRITSSSSRSRRSRHPPTFRARWR